MYELLYDIAAYVVGHIVMDKMGTDMENGLDVWNKYIKR